MPLLWTSSYVSVSGSESQENTNVNEKTDFIKSKILAHSIERTFIIWASILNSLILIISLSLFLSSRSSHCISGKNGLVKATSYYSPILESLEINTGVKKMNGSLWPPSNPSIARQMPNPEADAVWTEYELTRPIVMSKEDIVKLGKDPETTAKFEDDYWHFGEDAYIGQLDVFHQLHCLNALRKLIYPDYYTEKPTHQELYFTHYNHCVDILYQNIICTGNTDIITMQWMETQHHPFPDFSINHQCRDFDSLIQWRKDNSVDMKMWNKMEKPKGVTEVPAPIEYYATFAKDLNHESTHS